MSSLMGSPTTTVDHPGGGEATASSIDSPTTKADNVAKAPSQDENRSTGGSQPKPQPLREPPSAMPRVSVAASREIDNVMMPGADQPTRSKAVASTPTGHGGIPRIDQPRNTSQDLLVVRAQTSARAVCEQINNEKHRAVFQESLMNLPRDHLEHYGDGKELAMEIDCLSRGEAPPPKRPRGNYKQGHAECRR